MRSPWKQLTASPDMPPAQDVSWRAVGSEQDAEGRGGLLSWELGDRVPGDRGVLC